MTVSKVTFPERGFSVRRPRPDPPGILNAVRRVLVVGMPGSGKTTTARRIADRINLPFHELDMLAFGPHWSRPEHFVTMVEKIVAGPGWVIDSWGDEEVRDAMWASADTVVWLDYPARVVIPSVLRRSLSRSLTRVEVFNGNRETWSAWLSKAHPVWHAIHTFRARRDYLADRTARSPHLRTLRFRRRSELKRWLRQLRPG